MRGPAPTAAAHPCYPCPGGDGEVLLGHVVSLPSESGTAGRRYAQPCSECPILPREPGATEHPDPGDRGAAGGGREADLWVSFPPSSTSSVSGAPYPQNLQSLLPCWWYSPARNIKGAALRVAWSLLGAHTGRPVPVRVQEVGASRGAGQGVHRWASLESCI